MTHVETVTKPANQVKEANPPQPPQPTASTASGRLTFEDNHHPKIDQDLAAAHVDM
jgi:hypothetical protein